MTDHTFDSDDRVDRIASDIGNEKLDDATARQITDRVWDRLSAEIVENQPLTSCEDFQNEIPAFVAGDLSEARSLLVGDHTRSCVPCRRALMEARSGAPTEVQRDRHAENHRYRSVFLRIAAAVVLLAGGAATVRTVDNVLIDRDLRADVQSVEGAIHLVDGESTVALEPGAAIRSRQVIRTAKESGAFVRLADGSVVEMAERSELVLRASRRGTTIDLERGNIIVHAADQHGGRLFVATNDCEVAVKGTIFAVNHGLKGSRVSVIEGEVEVREGSASAILLPGDQIATGARLRSVPLEDEIAWSQDAEEYRALLREFTELQRAVASVIDTAPPRTSTFLLDLAPPDTMAYAAMPNLTEDLDAARAAFYDRLASSTTLSQWWQENVVDTGVEQEIESMLDRMQPIGEAIGAEAVVAVPMSVIHEQGGPLFMAEVTDPTALSELLIPLIDEANAQANGPTLKLVDDPFATEAVGTEMYLWIENTLFAATSDLEVLRGLAARLDDTAPRDFLQTDLHQRLAEVYADGASWLFGFDVAAAMSQAAEEMPPETLESLHQLGLFDATTLVVERHRDGEWYATNAEVRFAGQRRGIMNWLAEPAPMGSLEFVSQQAYFAASAATRDPVVMFDELMAMVEEQGQEAIDGLQLVQDRLGIDLREDLAATLGADGTIALDGPMLPVPSWKVIIEVYDPETLISTLERALIEINAELAANGQPEVLFDSSVAGGRTYYSLSRAGLSGTVVFTSVEGYLVIAPNRTLIEQAIDYRETGTNLTASNSFQALLPDNVYTDCSALVYRDLDSLVDAVPSEMLSQFGGTVGFGEGMSSGLICIFGESDRVLAGATGGSLVGLGALLGMHQALILPDAADETESVEAVSSQG